MHIEKRINNHTPTVDEKTSCLLQGVLTNLVDEKVPVGYLLEQLHRRSFGGMLIILSLIGLVPGISFFAGLVMLLPGIQMLLGYRAPRLPLFLHRRSINRVQLQTFGKRIIPWLQRVERFVRPRWTLFTLAPVPNLIGLIVTALALVIMLPLPFSNLPPAIALTCLSLGLLERDGLMIGIGFMLAVIALGIGVVIVSVAIQSTMLVL